MLEFIPMETSETVTVFWVRVDEDFPYSSIVRQLDDGERARASRFHFRADRDAFSAARVLLRRSLNELFGPRLRRYCESTGGKLSVEGEPVHFSLSHTRGCVAVAACSCAPVGMDVEGVGPEPEAVAEIAFAPSEVALLQQCSDESRRRETFFALWTAKEALVKATGQGMSAELKKFALALDPLRLLTPGPDGSPGEDWHLWSARRRAFRLAAAINCAGATISFVVTEVTPAELLLV